MAELVLDRVTKTYAHNVLGVEDINLEVKDRELVVIVGPSGCGKTTTLRLIAGLDEVTRGEIRIGGRRINGWPAHHRDVAMVFQDYALYPQLSVFENLAFGLRRRSGQLRLSGAEIDRRVREAADALRLSTLLDRKPRALSGGERQRVAFGRALVREPNVFLMDEPLSGLDLPLRIELRREISSMRHRVAAPMLYVTHDQSEAASMSDRTVLMHGGRVHQVGRWQDLYDRPVNRIVAEYTGLPPMNFLDGRIVVNAGEGWFQSGSLRLPLPMDVFERCQQVHGSEVVVGLRPSSITCRPAVGGASYVASVEAVECYGEAWHIRVRMNDVTLVCRPCDPWRGERGVPVELSFDMTRCHVFDTTGKNVARGIEQCSPGG